jgi:hypothetical protein
MRFARWVFLAAGVTGIALVLPPYFLEADAARDQPPLNHPEYYYGFFGLCLAWQVAFLVIGSDPARLRPMMLPAVLEKVSFVAAISVLFALQHVPASWLGFAAMDATWAVLFVLSYLWTPKDTPFKK